MDNFSYDPNSRIARRIKERERKRRRLKRIIAVVVAVVVIVVAAFCAVKFFGNLGGSKPMEETNNMNLEELQEQTATPEQEQEEQEEEPVLPSSLYPPASEVNDMKKILQNAKGETEKVCALTFDDGPNKSITPEILDILKKHEVEATFFAVGDSISKNKDIAKRIYDEGHLLANHTYTQNTSTIYKSWDNLYEEIEKTEKLITEIAGEETFKLVRLPGGSGGKKEYCAKLAENGYYYADWNLVFDGACTADEILSGVKENTGSESVIILMEEKKAAAEALEAVITHLKDSGYVFRRLDKIAY